MAHGPVRSDFERALKAARRDKLIYARHAGTVAAARALADKIDAWDVIVQWANDDVRAAGGGRPAVPDNDNTSIPAFLKYMNDLGLTPAADVARAKDQARTESMKASSSKAGGAPVGKLQALQEGVGLKAYRGEATA
ncbi:hypothetical protein FYJ24_06895 [Actinomycetaceae bacterium WB03_NA08]|uniref:Terminase small subunit actinomycetes phage-type domain-containing protein n=1 Tax=Scrofimicrobium canadense TaxID=2652290 RepID=A0A6N7VRU0_9ACTO|nr:hypothetical protein [Scrofimicrobium canadense]MSS84494.1 hypothetical protein [Scrofimicrobium canadense]